MQIQGLHISDISRGLVAQGHAESIPSKVKNFMHLLATMMKKAQWPVGLFGFLEAAYFALGNTVQI